MNEWLIMGQGFLLSLSLCFDLGIVNTAIIKTGLDRGFRPSLMLGLGSCFGDLFYLMLALSGVGVLFQIAAIKWSLWAVGTVYLLWLALHMARDALKPKKASEDGQASSDIRPASRLSDWLSGLTLALASPTSIVWFALVAGPLVSGMKLSHGFGLILFAAGFFLAGLAWSVSIAALSAWSGASLGAPFVRVISACAALLLLYLALSVFVGGIRELL